MPYRPLSIILLITSHTHQVVPVPLFEVLDPSPSSNDYLQRVEPSVQGGKKMASHFLHVIENNKVMGGVDVSAQGDGSEQSPHVETISESERE
jgi:hypothetical protein